MDDTILVARYGTLKMLGYNGRVFSGLAIFLAITPEDRVWGDGRKPVFLIEHTRVSEEFATVVAGGLLLAANAYEARVVDGDLRGGGMYIVNQFHEEEE